MPDQITNTKPVQTKAYVQAEGGVNNYVNNKGVNLGATIGGELSKGNTYAKAEVGCGTALKAEAEIGHEFDIGKNMGLELSANAASVESMIPTVLYESTIIRRENGTLEEWKRHTKWLDGIKKAGGAMMLSFHGKKGNVKAGLEMGAYKNTAPNVVYSTDVNTEDKDGNVNVYNATSIYEGHYSGFYATPKVSAELNLGKKDNWSLVADADIFGANAGIRFNF